MNLDEKTNMRLDKWLWCARLYKTRGLASDAIKSGKIQINDRKLKPSHLIHEGDHLTLRRGQFNLELKITALTNNRKSAKDAVSLYEESLQSKEKRQLLFSQLAIENKMYPRTLGRPTKRQRRDLLKFKTEPK
jgi:ribosome-associated heat shock protein Hsp15